jgi:hypothetical protein
MTEEFDTATSTGRLMLTFLSGFAAHERELIRERSMAGSNRLAEDCSATEPRLPDCMLEAAGEGAILAGQAEPHCECSMAVSGDGMA